MANFAGINDFLFELEFYLRYSIWTFQQSLTHIFFFYEVSFYCNVIIEAPGRCLIQKINNPNEILTSIN